MPPPRPTPATEQREPLLAGTVQFSPQQRARLKDLLARFEDAWFDGQKISIDDALPADDPPLRRVALAELVHIELELRLKAGEPVALRDYLARFPELADDHEAAQSLVAAEGRFRPGSGAASTFGAADGNRRSGSGQAGLFYQRLVNSRLLTPEQLKEVLAAVARTGPATVESVSAELLKRELVTEWQLAQLQAGQITFFIDNDRYLLLRLIGQGGMGAVYKARHTRLGRDVALKVIDPRRVTDKSLIDRFRREIDVCSRLQHEHIVHADDVGEHAGTTFLVLEYVDGSDLSSLVKRDGPLPPDEAAAVCLQAAAGLAYAHAEGIIHRDIKPQNILLSTAGVVKILDMGLARITEQRDDDPHTALTGTGAVMGTVDYMSPEQATDTRSADARSDLYSLGATLYYLLAGRPPFPGGAIIEKLQRLALEDPAPLGSLRPDCPPALVALTHKLLAKRPSDRFQSASELIRALRPLAAENVSGRPVLTSAVHSAAAMDTLPSTADPTSDSLPAPADFALSPGERAGVRASPASPFSLFEEPEATLPRRAAKPRRAKVWLPLALAAVALIAFGGWWFARDPAPARAPASKSASGKAPPSASLAPPEIRRELTDHFAPILSVALSPDGRTLATGGFDSDVYFRDAKSRKMLSVFRGHQAAVGGIVWSPDGTLLASADDFGVIHIHQPGADKPLYTFRRNPAVIHNGIPAMAFSPDGKEFAFYGAPDIIRWRLGEPKPLWSEKFHAPLNCIHLAYSPDARYLAVGTVDFLNVYDLHSNTLVFETNDRREWGSQWMLVPQFLSDGTLAVARAEKLQVWNLHEKKLLHEFPIQPLAMFNTEAARLVAFSASGEEFLVITATQAQLLKTRTGNLLQAAPFNFGVLIQWCAAARLNRVALRDGHASLIVCDPFAVEANVSVPPSFLPAPGGHERPAVLAGRFVRYGGSCLDLQRGEWLPPEFLPQSPCPMPDGSLRFLAYNRDAPTEVLFAKSLAEQTPLRRVPLEDQFSNDAAPIWIAGGTQLVEFSARLKAARFWDAESGRLIRSLPYPENATDRWDISPSGKRLLSFLVDNTVQVWSGSADEKPRLLPGVTAYHGSLISPDDRFLAVMRNAEPPLAIHELPSARLIFEPKFGSIPATSPVNFEFSADGRYLLTTRELWDLSVSPPAKRWECSEPDRAVGSVFRHGVPMYRDAALFPDNTHVAVAQDCQIQIWNWHDNKKRASLLFLPDGEWAFLNHESGHYNASTFAFKHLRFRHVSKSGAEEWLLERDFIKKNPRWKNDPAQAALKLSSISPQQNHNASIPFHGDPKP